MTTHDNRRRGPSGGGVRSAIAVMYGGNGGVAELLLAPATRRWQRKPPAFNESTSGSAGDGIDQLHGDEGFPVAWKAKVRPGFVSVMRCRWVGPHH